MRKPSSSCLFLFPYLLAVVVEATTTTVDFGSVSAGATATSAHRRASTTVTKKDSFYSQGLRGSSISPRVDDEHRRQLRAAQSLSDHRALGNFMAAAMAAATTPPDDPYHIGRRSSTSSSISAALLLLQQTPPQGSSDNGTGSDSAELSPRIVGGSLVAPGTYPFFVQGSGCGATLVAPDVVLSAAHCLDAFAQGGGSVIVGNTQYDVVTDGAQRRQILSPMVPHPSYDEMTMRYDYLMFKIEAVTEAGIVPAVLNDNDLVPYDNQVVTVAGFGATEEGGLLNDNLLDVDLQVVGTDVCQAQMDVALPGVQVAEDIMLCAGIDAGGYDSCQGDSGGPLLTSDNVLVGVVSFGPGCARPHTPGIYSRVSGQIGWIKSTLCELTDAPPTYCDQYAGSDTGNATATTDDNSNDGDADGTRCLWCVWEWLDY